MNELVCYVVEEALKMGLITGRTALAYFFGDITALEIVEEIDRLHKISMYGKIAEINRQEN